MASSNIAVFQKENNIDKSAILGYECESAQEVESETIGSRQLGPPLPSMRVPPCTVGKTFAQNCMLECC